MSENRVNNQNEQLKAEMRAAQNRKVKTKVLQKSTQVHTSAQAKTLIKTKQDKSPFDQMLENMSHEGTASVIGQSGFESHLAEVRPRDEQGNRQETKEEKQEDKNTSEKKESTQERGQTNHRRITGKKGLKEQGEGQGEGGDGKLAAKTAKKGEVKTEGQNKKTTFDSSLKGVAPAPVMPVQSQAIEGIQATQGPKELPPAVLAQIIQAATISRDKELNTEMKIEFQDNFFNGTTLKVLRDKSGNISITFLVPNRHVEATFKNEREKIAEALGKKELDIRDIRVELS